MWTANVNSWAEILGSYIEDHPSSPDLLHKLGPIEIVWPTRSFIVHKLRPRVGEQLAQRY